MPTNPELLKMPFAQDGDKNSIPETTSPTTGLFSQQYGFQSINSLPLTAGGKAISRLDYNGAMYMLSNLLYYAQRGYTFVYDDNMPYVVGCRVLDPNDGQVYNCVADVAAGVGAPSATPANWELAPSADVLGFRKPDTAYKVGQIAYHASLPTGYYLECTTPGTTSSGDLSIGGGISVYDTLTDGTVTWTVLNVFVALKDKAGNDLEGIVSKSLTPRGYVKYASGLIVQWLWWSVNGYLASSDTQIDFPISFTNESSYTIVGSTTVGGTPGIAVAFSERQASYAKAKTSLNNASTSVVYLIAIGY